MKKPFFIVGVILFFYFKCYSQNKLSEKIYTGGNIGVQFGAITYLDISPHIGYKLTNKWSKGVGVSYIYLRNNISKLGSSIYGGRLFSKYLFLNNLYAHAEYEVLNLSKTKLTGELGRINVSSFLVGGGYIHTFEWRSSLHFLVLWDLFENSYSYYKNPIVRIGFGIGY